MFLSLLHFFEEFRWPSVFFLLYLSLGELSLQLAPYLFSLTAIRVRSATTESEPSSVFSFLSSSYWFCTSTAYYSTLLYSTLLYSTLLYSTLLYSTLLYSTLLYSTLLYSTLLYSTLLYSTLLYSTLLYSTLLYSTLLYSTLLYSS